MPMPSIKGSFAALAGIVLVLLVFAGMWWAFGAAASWGQAPNWLLPAIAVAIALLALLLAWRGAGKRAGAGNAAAARGLLVAVLRAVLMLLGALALVAVLGWFAL
jgi:hypothetical protein